MKKNQQLILLGLIALVVLLSWYLIYNFSPSIQQSKIMMEVDRITEKEHLNVQDKTVVDKIKTNGITVYVVDVHTTEETYYVFLEKQLILGFNIHYETISMLSEKGEVDIQYKK